MHISLLNHCNSRIHKLHNHLMITPEGMLKATLTLLNKRRRERRN